MPFLKRDGGEIFYDECGKGEPIVILRGLGRSIRHWLGYEKELAKHARVITMDLRGIGRSTAPWTFRTSIFDAASDVAAVLDELALERAHVMGVSLGGMVTLATGLRYRQRCKSLVVVNTSVAGQFVPRISPRALLTLTTALYDRKRLQSRLVDVLVGPGCEPTRREEIAELYGRIAREDGLGGETVVRQLVAAARFYVLPELAKLDLETLVVYGTDDCFVPRKNSLRLAARLPKARLVALEGAGHEPTLDCSEQMTQVVRDWLGV